MHNWLELEHHCRERAAEAVRWAEEERRVQVARASARARRREGARRARRGREHRPAMLVLARGNLLTIKVGRRGIALACVTGRVWATISRESADVVLRAGGSAAFPTRGTLVIEALGTATIRIECLRQPRAVFAPWASALTRPRIAL